MRLSIRYVTRFVYATPVWDSQNALRARPHDGDTQRLLSYDVRVTPEAQVLSYLDRWGTHVDTFGVRAPHDELTVTVETEVETTGPPPVTPTGGSILDDDYRDSVWEFLQPTRHTRWSADIADIARDAVGDADGVLETIETIDRLVHDSIEYRPGATHIGVDVDRVWQRGVGVCQDFAHLAIALLRSAGVGARYVSGYFYASDPTADSAGDEGEIVVATHAWVEAAIPGSGWWAFDPTNAAPVGERHVKIGHGRDYDDVTPLRGVYYGDTDHHLAAEVTMSTGRIGRRDIPVVTAPYDQQRALSQSQ